VRARLHELCRAVGRLPLLGAQDVARAILAERHGIVPNIGSSTIMDRQ
jgi:hypothetical protein